MSEPSAVRGFPASAWRIHVVGASVLLAVAAVALAIGPVRIDPVAAWFAPADDPTHLILVGARAPRILLAALVGAALGLAGAALQALLRNPLACPHVLGISGGAALFAILATLALPLGAAGISPWAGALAVVPAAALAGALLTAALVHAVAATSGAPTPTTLLLTGVVFNSLAAAIITLVDALVDPQRSRGMLAWVIGTITVRGLPWALVATATLVAGTALLLASARDLNALALGEEGAAALGVGVARARRRVYLAVALLVAGAVPVSGMIGFVGLIVPHLVRSFAGGDQRRVVPAALWGGAAFLVAADALARSLLATELPVGVVTALCGGPFFLHLLRREGRSALGDAA